MKSNWNEGKQHAPAAAIYEGFLHKKTLVRAARTSQTRFR